MKAYYIINKVSALALMLVATATAMAQTIDIKFNGNSATVSVPGNVSDVQVQRDGAYVSIVSSTADKEYTYRVSGSTTNGSLTLTGGYKLTLELNGATITSQRGAAIDVQCGKRIAVIVNEGTVNTLTDLAGGSQKAAMYFAGHPEFSGAGTLNVTGNAKHAISAKEYLQIKGSFGTLNVLGAVSDGIHCGKEKVAEWDEEMTANENEFFRCNGGNINIRNCGGDCIDTGNYGCMLIKGGSLNLAVAGEDVVGLKSPNTFIMQDGQVNIDVTGLGSDGIYINNEARLLGGEINIDVRTNGSKGIKGKKKASSAYPQGGNVKIQDCKVNVVARGGDDMTDPNDPSHCVGISIDGNLSLGGNVKVTAVGDARGITCDGTKTGTAEVVKQHWYANPYDFQYDMSAYFSLNVNGLKVKPTDVELAAFVGGECRGVGEALKGADDVYYMRIRSNKTSGETITFKVFVNGKECAGVAAEAVSFSSDGQIGKPSKTVVVNCENNTGTATITIASTDETMGTVIGAGAFEEGQTVTLEAVAKEGYHFVRWSDGNTNAKRSLTITSSMTLTAEFAPNLYKVVFMADGVVIAESTQEFGSKIDVPAAPEKEGYTFVGWGNVDATVPAHDVTYVAVYEKNTGNGIDSITSSNKPAGIYTATGIRIKALSKGLNIIIDKEGSTKKIIIK